MDSFDFSTDYSFGNDSWNSVDYSSGAYDPGGAAAGGYPTVDEAYSAQQRQALISALQDALKGGSVGLGLGGIPGGILAALGTGLYSFFNNASFASDGTNASGNAGPASPGDAGFMPPGTSPGDAGFPGAVDYPGAPGSTSPGTPGSPGTTPGAPVAPAVDPRLALYQALNAEFANRTRPGMSTPMIQVGGGGGFNEKAGSQSIPADGSIKANSWSDVIGDVASGVNLGASIADLFGWGGDDSNTATTETTRSPAPWSSVGPGAQDAWNNVLGGVYNAAGYADPSLTGTTYANQQNQVLEDLVREMGGLSSSYLSGTGGATSDYTSRMEELSRPAYSIKVAGQDVGVTPRRNSMLADMAQNVMSAKVGQSGREFQTGGQMADLNYQFGNQQIPLNMLLAGTEKLWPYMSQMQGWRFGLPSTTESATYNPSLSENLARIVQASQSVNDLWNTTKNNPA